MTADDDRRPGECSVSLPVRSDAALVFIGRIRTPWADRQDCPKQGTLDGPACHIDIDPRWADALDGIGIGDRLQVLYWMHLARRDLTRQRPRSRPEPIGTFALRSPVRPNPIASSVVQVIDRAGSTLTVRGLDCIDGTPLLDLKPERCPVSGGS